VARERNYLGNGSCPSGLRPLLKTLAGWPGDQVEITPNGLVLNGEALLNTARLERDRSGREMPPSILSPGRIPDGLGLAVSLEHSGSFDSRYFGLVPFASLRKAEPIFVF
jgi:conjugative transfer signal peptidase TraF